MARAGGRILGAGLADDVLMDLGPLTLVVAPATEGQALWLSRLFNIWSDVPTEMPTLKGNFKLTFLCFTKLDKACFLLRSIEDSQLGEVLKL